MGYWEISLPDGPELQIVLEVGLGGFQGEEEEIEAEHAHDAEDLGQIERGHGQQVAQVSVFIRGHYIIEKYPVAQVGPDGGHQKAQDKYQVPLLNVNGYFYSDDDDDAGVCWDLAEKKTRLIGVEPAGVEGTAEGIYRHKETNPSLTHPEDEPLRKYQGWEQPVLLAHEVHLREIRVQNLPRVVAFAHLLERLLVGVDVQVHLKDGP